jgi:hypothetical protein
MLDIAFDGQRPLLQIHFGIDDVVTVVGEVGEGDDVGIRKRGRKVLGTEQGARRPVTEMNAGRQQGVAQPGHGKQAQCDHGRKLQQFPTAFLFQCPVFQFFDHERRVVWRS